MCAHSVKLCPHFRLQPKFHYNIHIPAARYQVQSSRVGRACKSITGHAYHDAARRRRSIHQTIYRRTLFLAKEKNRKNVNSKANTFPDQSLFCFDREHLLQCFLQYTLNLVRGSTSGTPTWFVGRTVAPTNQKTSWRCQSIKWLSIPTTHLPGAQSVNYFLQRALLFNPVNLS